MLTAVGSSHSQYGNCLIEPLTGIGDNDSKLPEKVVGPLVGDNRDLEVLAGRLRMMALGCTIKQNKAVKIK
jgi:hypothetical protein